MSREMHIIQLNYWHVKKKADSHTTQCQRYLWPSPSKGSWMNLYSILCWLSSRMVHAMKLSWLHPSAPKLVIISFCRDILYGCWKRLSAIWDLLTDIFIGLSIHSALPRVWVSHLYSQSSVTSMQKLCVLFGMWQITYLPVGIHLLLNECPNMKLHQIM